MSSLFIIGNGFDRAHGLETSYEDFHQYLKREYPNAEQSDYVPDFVTDGNGEEVAVNEDEVVGFIENVLCDVEGDKWSDLEASIGKIEFENYIDDYENDEEDDDDLYHEEQFNESWANSLISPIIAIPNYFNEWISTIEYNDEKFKNDFVKLINSEDLFLSFNYTRTLEYLYRVKDVCHIHGVQGGKLLFGHGNDYNYFSDEVYGVRAGTEESFQKMHDSLKKDTRGAIIQHKDFFDKVRNSSIDKIFSYGFSFGEVDEIYIKYICECIDTSNVNWYLNGFDDEEARSKFKSIIKKCNFKGSFSVYDIYK